MNPKSGPCEGNAWNMFPDKILPRSCTINPGIPYVQRALRPLQACGNGCGGMGVRTEMRWTRGTWLRRLPGPTCTESRLMRSAKISNRRSPTCHGRQT
jgi:hypothetical protein